MKCCIKQCGQGKFITEAKLEGCNVKIVGFKTYKDSLNPFSNCIMLCRSLCQQALVFLPYCILHFPHRLARICKTCRGLCFVLLKEAHSMLIHKGGFSGFSFLSLNPITFPPPSPPFSFFFLTVFYQ